MQARREFTGKPEAERKNLPPSLTRGSDYKARSSDPGGKETMNGPAHNAGPFAFCGPAHSPFALSDGV